MKRISEKGCLLLIASFCLNFVSGIDVISLNGIWNLKNTSTGKILHAIYFRYFFIVQGTCTAKKVFDGMLEQIILRQACAFAHITDFPFSHALSFPAGT